MPSAVLSRVSAETSTANQPAALSTTVRHAPEQATDAPIAMPPVS
jgi:hypothetical protein